MPKNKLMTMLLPVNQHWTLCIETDRARIAELAALHCDDYAAFGHYIDIMWEREARPDAELDALVDAIAAEVVPHIDCTTCAHCCSSLVVGMTPEDIPPLAAALGSSPEQVTAQYIDFDAGARWDEWGVLRCSPCAWLDGERCMVYANRPQSCHDYPALTPDFRWLWESILGGVGQCPIIFNVIEHLKIRLGW